MLANASSVMAQPTSIQVEGQLAGNNFVSATCTIGNNGQITGTGVLYGQNTVTGATWKYPFAISKGVTSQGKLILTGKVVGGPDLTLTCSVPTGAMVFSYVVNGNTYSLAGTGTVTVK